MTLVTTYRAAGCGVTGREPLTIAITRRVEASVGQESIIPPISSRHDPVAVLMGVDAMTETELVMAVRDLVVEDMGKLYEGLLEAEVERDDIRRVLYTVGVADDKGMIADEASVAFYAEAPKYFLTPTQSLASVIYNELYKGDVWNQMTPGLIPLIEPRLRPSGALSAQPSLDIGKT